MGKKEITLKNEMRKNVKLQNTGHFSKFWWVPVSNVALKKYFVPDDLIKQTIM